jgi:hypothetical protein
VPAECRKHRQRVHDIAERAQSDDQNPGRQVGDSLPVSGAGDQGSGIRASRRSSVVVE